jgi:hypothetical protein
MFSCVSTRENWEGGIITDVGKYEHQDYTVYVNDPNFLIEYYMLNGKGDTVLSANHKFNTFQSWALHLDKELNLWVFSSDIGHSRWQRDSLSGRYKEHEYWGEIPLDSIPKDVYETLSKFYPYNRER